MIRIQSDNGTSEVLCWSILLLVVEDAGHRNKITTLRTIRKSCYRPFDHHSDCKVPLSHEYNVDNIRCQLRIFGVLVALGSRIIIARLNVHPHHLTGLSGCHPTNKRGTFQIRHRVIRYPRVHQGTQHSKQRSRSRSATKPNFLMFLPLVKSRSYFA
jgi:hypothetical protein